jgi:hypothetical protein
LYHEAEDFKTYIDREYQQLKLDLEAMRNPPKHQKPEPCNNFTSICNLSDISTKNNEAPSISISFNSNPFKSPKHESVLKPKSRIVTGKAALQERLTSFLNEKDEEFEKAEKVEKVEKEKTLKNKRKFTIESNNIEIRPALDKGKKEILRDMDRVQSVEKMPNEAGIEKNRRTCRSSSDRKRGKDKKRRDKQLNVGNFHPFPAYPFQGFYPFHYPVYQSNFYQDPSTFYPSTNLDHYMKTEISEKTAFPFLFGTDDQRCFTQNDDFIYKFDEYEKNFDENLKKEKNSENDLKSEKIEKKTSKNSESRTKNNEDSSKTQEKPGFYSETSPQTEPVADLHQEEHIPTFGDDSIDINQDPDFSDSRSEETFLKKPVFIEIGETDSKPLSEIFFQRKPKTAEKLQIREENLQKSTHKEKSKDQLIEIRKNLLKGTNSEKKSKSPPRRRQKSSELTDRLLSGQRAKISKEEMYSLSKKNYKALPEVQFRESEEKKRQEKQSRIEKLKEFEKVIKR